MVMKKSVVFLLLLIIIDRKLQGTLQTFAYYCVIPDVYLSICSMLRNNANLHPLVMNI